VQEGRRAEKVWSGLAYRRMAGALTETALPHDVLEIMSEPETDPSRLDSSIVSQRQSVLVESKALSMVRLAFK